MQSRVGYTGDNSKNDGRVVSLESISHKSLEVRAERRTSEKLAKKEDNSHDSSEAENAFKHCGSPEDRQEEEAPEG